jgi:hypothetical protein
MTERDAHVERIRAMQVSEGQQPFPLPPQPRNVVEMRPVLEHAQESTGDAAAASSHEVPEEAGDPAADVPTHQPEYPPAHPKNALSNQWLCAVGDFYANQRKQKEFDAALCCIDVRGDRRAEFQSLLGGQGTTIAHYYYERAAGIAHRDKGWGPQKKLLELLVEIISGREKVADWHSQLPADDPAKVGPGGDRNMIAVLKRTYAILNHSGVYEIQEEAPRRRAAVQPALRQLPVSVPQQQLPVQLVQPMRFENAGEQRSRTYPSQMTMLIRSQKNCIVHASGHGKLPIVHCRCRCPYSQRCPQRSHLPREQLKRLGV